MKRRSKKYKAAMEMLNPTCHYDVDEALDLAIKTASAKFDETVDLAFLLGVSPKHADQMIRGAMSLPSGTGKDIKVAVITTGEKISIAQNAGADHAGEDDLIQKIAGGWLDFDRLIASPDIMGKMGKIGRILGPRGLMPNPKLGTVTMNVEKAVKEQKAGTVEYRTDKEGNVHVPIGKKSFGREKLKKNFAAIMGAIIKAKPVSAKGDYIQGLVISSTMGPGIKMDVYKAMALTSS
ncbi:MAG: 50S ribosomal protein L1 [Halobacteriovoraceae bacterium]|nr:50S ribosomal protein L1 [Halobacteriovoraceae bacterium]